MSARRQFGEPLLRAVGANGTVWQRLKKVFINK